VLFFVVGDGATEQQAKKFTKELEDQLKNRTDLSLVAAPSTSPRGKAEAAAKAPRASPEAAAALEAGKKAYADLKFDEATEKLKKGLELSLQDPASVDWPRLHEAQLELAVSAFRLGEEKDAAAALLTMARWNPATDVSSFPPVFQREFEKAKKKLEKLGKQILAVDGPPGATAFIDGRDLGMVPVEETVAAGTHYVKVEGAKGEKWGQAVEVKAAAVKVKGVFTGSPEKPSAPAVEPKMSSTLDQKVTEKLAAWCGSTGADFAVVGVVWRSSATELSVASAVYWTRKEGFAPLATGMFPEGAAGGEHAARMLDKLVERVEMFGTTLALPHALQPKGAAKGLGGDEVAVATVRDRPTPAPRPQDAAQPELVPKPADDRQVPIDEPPPEVKTEMSTTAKVVLIISGVVVAAGAGVGTYFIVSNATKPVTGTVTATW
jgi:PEGA domain